MSVSKYQPEVLVAVDEMVNTWHLINLNEKLKEDPRIETYCKIISKCVAKILDRKNETCAADFGWKRVWVPIEEKS